jgi:hypothetical protein
MPTYVAVAARESTAALLQRELEASTGWEWAAPAEPSKTAKAAARSAR